MTQKTLTVVYRGLSEDQAQAIFESPNARAYSWGEGLQQKNIAVEALKRLLDEGDDEVVKIAEHALKQIKSLNND